MAKKPRSSRRIFLIIGMTSFIIVSGIGGYFAWDYYQKMSAVVVEFDTYYKLNSIRFPVIRGDSISKTVQLDIAVYFSDETSKERFLKKYPLLHNAFLTSLMDYFTLLQENQTVSADDLRERIFSNVNHIVGPDIITRVDIEGAFESKRRL